MWWICLVTGTVIGVISQVWIVALVRQTEQRKYTEALRKLTIGLSESAAAEAEARRKAADYFALIEGTVAECKEWKKLYYLEAAMHGKAQQLLFSQLSSLTEQFRRATKREPTVSPLVNQVLAAYSGQHPTPHPPLAAPGLQEPGPSEIGTDKA